MIEGGVVFAGQVVHRLDPQPGHDGFEFLHAPSTLDRIIGRVGEVAGEHHEVGRTCETVDGGDRLAQGDLGLGIGRSLVAPVGVGQLHEMEIALRHAAQTGTASQSRCEYDAAADGGELEDVSAMHRGVLASGIVGSVPRCGAEARVMPVDTGGGGGLFPCEGFL